MLLLYITVCTNNISARLCLQNKVYHSPKPHSPVPATYLVHLLSSFIRVAATSSWLLFAFSLTASSQHTPFLLLLAARLILQKHSLLLAHGGSTATGIKSMVLALFTRPCMIRPPASRPPALYLAPLCCRSTGLLAVEGAHRAHFHLWAFAFARPSLWMALPQACLLRLQQITACVQVLSKSHLLMR